MSPDLQSNRKMMENVFNEQRGSSVAYNAVSSFQPNRVSSQTSLEVLRQGWQRFD